ncbi:hypothetical protein Trydic_g23719 [Trypoxylus dichotomus]
MNHKILPFSRNLEKVPKHLWSNYVKLHAEWISDLSPPDPGLKGTKGKMNHNSFLWRIIGGDFGDGVIIRVQENTRRQLFDSIGGDRYITANALYFIVLPPSEPPPIFDQRKELRFIFLLVPLRAGSERDRAINPPVAVAAAVQVVVAVVGVQVAVAAVEVQVAVAAVEVQVAVAAVGVQVAVAAAEVQVAVAAVEVQVAVATVQVAAIPQPVVENLAEITNGGGSKTNDIHGGNSDINISLDNTIQTTNNINVPINISLSNINHVVTDTKTSVTDCCLPGEDCKDGKETCANNTVVVERKQVIPIPVPFPIKEPYPIHIPIREHVPHPVPVPFPVPHPIPIYQQQQQQQQQQMFGYGGGHCCCGGMSSSCTHSCSTCPIHGGLLGGYNYDSSTCCCGALIHPCTHMCSHCSMYGGLLGGMGFGQQQQQQQQQLFGKK